jgi:hypothetical protein
VFSWHAALFVMMIAQAPEAPAVTVRLDRPAEQARRVIALFEGTDAPNPAAALSQWKRATEGKKSLGKAAEALIAAFNPGMANELRAFDGAECQVSFPTGASPRWNATLPSDVSHIFAALATAMALTDGGPEPPLGPFQVDRLGPEPGGILMAHADGRVILGRDVDDLRHGQERLNEPRPAGESSRIQIRISPEQFGTMPTLPSQRLVEAARGLALTRIDIAAAFEGETFSIETTGQSSHPFVDEGGIDPSWLDLPCSDRAFVVAALRFDRSETGLERLFSLADRIEKTDPAKAKAAPTRTRLNLLALGLGIRPEVDLWPKLEGISACAAGDENGKPTGAVLALHAIDELSAERLTADFLPRLARAAGLKGEDLGVVAGRSLAVTRLGKSVIVTWGEVAESPKQDWPLGDVPPARFLLVRPDRILGFAPPGSPLAAGLAALPPIVWEGGQRDGLAVDRLQVGGLKGAVKAFLEALPRQPTPAEFRDADRSAL